MELAYPSKKSLQSIKNLPHPKKYFGNFQIPTNTNLLIFGDNLLSMSALIKEHSFKSKVDLVYIDPPFATNTVFRGSEHRTAHVSSSRDDEIAYKDTLVGEEYLEFLRERLIFIRELMADSASIYLHIDYKVGHYVKVVMDEIFGIQNFRNDITRIKCNPKNFSRKAYGNIKDLILYYTKTNQYTWNEPKGLRSENEIHRLFNKQDSYGRYYTTNPLHAPGETVKGNTGKEWKGMHPPKGRHWRYDPKVLDELDAQGLIEWSKSGNPRKIIYADDMPHKKLQDIWEFKDPIHPSYPTEKNLDLLKLIISTSSNEGDLILDCFCGSGGSLVAAQDLQRRWVGIDNSRIAIRTTQKRLAKLQPTLLSDLPGYALIET